MYGVLFSRLCRATISILICLCDESLFKSQWGVRAFCLFSFDSICSFHVTHIFKCRPRNFNRAHVSCLDDSTPLNLFSGAGCNFWLITASISLCGCAASTTCAASNAIITKLENINYKKNRFRLV